MTTLTFEKTIEILELADILKKLDEITPDTSLHIELKENVFVTKITIFPAVPIEKKEEMEKLAVDISAKLEM